MSASPPPSDPADVTADDLLEARILFVDDEEVNVVLLERILASLGYRRLLAVTDPREVPRLVREEAVDLVITDLHMPGLDGQSLITQVMAERPEGDWFPIAVLTADQNPRVEQEALRRGAKDFLTKPFRKAQIHLRVQNLLRTRALHLALRRHAERLEDEVRDRTRQLETAHMDLLERLALAAEFRDQVTGHHTQRVGRYAALLADRLGLPHDQVELLRLAAPLHDVGKIGVPDAILLKPGRLTDAEFAIMKEHVDVGARLLAHGHSELMDMAEEIALTHHERWDGSGYPRGLAGEAIPLVGQIVAIVDVFDTLINERPYKPAWPVEKAIDELRRQSGRWFAPRLVAAFLSVLVEERRATRGGSGGPGDGEPTGADREARAPTREAGACGGTAPRDG